jgi:hypothetical protein
VGVGCDELTGTNRGVNDNRKYDHVRVSWINHMTSVISEHQYIKTVYPHTNIRNSNKTDTNKDIKNYNIHNINMKINNNYINNKNMKINDDNILKNSTSLASFLMPEKNEKNFKHEKNFKNEKNEKNNFRHNDHNDLYGYDNSQKTDFESDKCGAWISLLYPYTPLDFDIKNNKNDNDENNNDNNHNNNNNNNNDKNDNIDNNRNTTNIENYSTNNENYSTNNENYSNDKNFVYDKNQSYVQYHFICLSNNGSSVYRAFTWGKGAILPIGMYVYVYIHISIYA